MIDLTTDLKPLAASDLSAISALFSMEPVYRYLFDGKAPTPDACKSWIAHSIEQAARTGIGAWVARGEGTIEAVIQILPGETASDRELVWIVHPDLHGRGMATRLARFGQTEAFRDPCVKFVWAGTDEANAASVRVMQKSGMKYWKDVSYPLGRGIVYRAMSEPALHHLHNAQ